VFGILLEGSYKAITYKNNHYEKSPQTGDFVRQNTIIKIGLNDSYFEQMNIFYKSILKKNPEHL